MATPMPVPTLGELCIQRATNVLHQRGDLEGLEVLPEQMALELLRAVVAQTSSGGDRSVSASWAGGWLRRRPPPELHLLGDSADMSRGFYSTRPSVEVRLQRLGSDVFTSLRHLRLSHAPNLTDTSLGPLTLAPCIEELRIHGCPLLTGSFLIPFSRPTGFPPLQQLFCSACPGLQDAHVSSVVDMPTLQKLGLPGAIQLSDSFVAALSGGAAPTPLPQTARNLVYLDLSQTSVSDAGAELLSRLKHLEALLLSRTSKISSAMLRRLCSSLRLQSPLPDRPKVLLKSLAAAKMLKEVEFGSDPFGGVASAALTAAAAKVVLMSRPPSEIDFWPEIAVRHGVAMLHLDRLEESFASCSAWQAMLARDPGRKRSLQSLQDVSLQQKAKMPDPSHVFLLFFLF
eukprot:TRINITY_DN4427_c0_g1_i5.p1 TRINITY_DN4427_c0_g1~~TRINITY_DN4427_c0_g1_i5.p1  ORF type:complete len:400 (-),score=79.21 TRINITY_DN4427_c0_g1_i5:14-1213(-)